MRDLVFGFYLFYIIVQFFSRASSHPPYNWLILLCGTWLMIVSQPLLIQYVGCAQTITSKHLIYSQVYILFFKSKFTDNAMI